MKDGVRIINESRAEIVDDDAMLAAIASGRVGKYVTDFPNEKVVGVDNIIALPHLGACTPESEEKSAVMAARELYDYLANGNIKNSVNFPDATLERMGVSRVCILHQNVPTMLNQFLEIVTVPPNMSRRTRKAASARSSASFPASEPPHRGQRARALGPAEHDYVARAAHAAPALGAARQDGLELSRGHAVHRALRADVEHQRVARRSLRSARSGTPPRRRLSCRMKKENCQLLP